MSLTKVHSISRRRFLKTSAVAAAGLSVVPYIRCTRGAIAGPIKRTFGKLNYDVTTLGLGGQASIQWTPEDVDPVSIILKAFDLGVNYFDTSNVYGPSQMNFGTAFRKLELIPGLAGYKESLRKSIWLTSKTHLRWAKGAEKKEGVSHVTNGAEGSHTVDDLKRSLSQIFGDREGNYPEGAYLDMMLIHNLTTLQEVDVLYEGLENPDPKSEQIGALAALRDYRDGTNLTGLNPKEEKLIRHIGFSGHYSAPVMMEMIQRDKFNVLDAMLVAINANDRLNFNMQHNVIPVASAKNMGVIAMKVFADGAMYTKNAEWSWNPGHVVRTVGSESLPSRHLIEYSLTTPGVHTAIIGIGQISDNPEMCQLNQNFTAAQIEPGGLCETERNEVEKITSIVKEGKTNYFQVPEGGLTAPGNPSINQELKDEQRTVNLTWFTAYAGDEPIKTYEILRDNEKVGEVNHKPQTTKEPFVFAENVTDRNAHEYKLVSVDRIGRKAETEDIILPPME
jgi:aryl-alcohol dehydrogenase-like predicted oxidoreductase